MACSNAPNLRSSGQDRYAVRLVGHRQAHRRHAGERLNADHRSTGADHLHLHPDVARSLFLHRGAACNPFSHLRLPDVARSLFLHRSAVHSLIFHLQPGAVHNLFLRRSVVHNLSLHRFPGVGRSPFSRLQTSVVHSLFLHRSEASLMGATHHHSCRQVFLDAGHRHPYYRSRLNAAFFPLLRLAWTVGPCWYA